MYLQPSNIAKQLADKLNERLNYVPTEKVEEEDVNEFQVFEEELEINDFPQQVRFKICSRVSCAVELMI